MYLNYAKDKAFDRREVCEYASEDVAFCSFFVPGILAQLQGALSSPLVQSWCSTGIPKARARYHSGEKAKAQEGQVT